MKVGFTPEQSGFMGRLSAETRSEAVEAVIDHVEDRDEFIAEVEAARRSFRITFVILVAVVSFVVGRAFA